MMPNQPSVSGVVQIPADMKLFYACFVALVTTAFGFIVRAFVLPQWGEEFNLSQTQLGEIAGVGLWPFAISIVLFSLIIDRIGYKTAMIFAVICHLSSAIITIFATGYNMLYIGTFIVALGNGTVEAVVNPVVATMFPTEKTKWLNRLHAAWPGGLVLGGVLAMFMGAETGWEFKVGLIFIPTVLYGLMMLARKFPLNERVSAGVTYREMLQEVGAFGALIIFSLIVFQLGSIFNWSTTFNVILIFVITAIFGWYTKSLGQPVFIILLLIMIPLAITELGTDSWITDLMTPEMNNLGLQAGWVLIYTSAIMFVLRLFAGPIIHKLSALGLLAACSAIAMIGLYLLSGSAGLMILIAATIYGIGKTFFWGTMLGVVSEQFPKGGALTLNITGGLGMIAAGVIGATVLGYVQDKKIETDIIAFDQSKNTSVYQKYVTIEKKSLFGEYRAIDQEKLDAGTENDKKTILEIRDGSKKAALKDVLIFPAVMLVGFVGLIIYFRSRGGYKPVVLSSHQV